MAQHSLSPPFVLFYFYLGFARAFNSPAVSSQEFFQSEIPAWPGVCFCLAGLLLSWSLISLLPHRFQNSFHGFPGPGRDLFPKLFLQPDHEIRRLCAG
jgi:hypothetical protein